MRNVLKITLFAAATLLGASSSWATTLNFSDLTSGSCNFVGSPVTSQGFTFLDISGGGLFLCNPGVLQNNTTPAMIAANSKSILSVAPQGGGTFSLHVLCRVADVL